MTSSKYLQLFGVGKTKIRLAMIEIQNWGLIDYQTAWDKQKLLVKDIQQKRDRSVLVLCQHPSVITIGKTGSDKNIVCHRGLLESIGIDVIYSDRGGDVTLHNPGQLVGYPIFNLSDYKEDLHWFLREVEGAIIELLKIYGIESGRVEGLTGVWVESKRKICAMGMHCSRWVTSHGFALNVNNDISEFGYIIPCGISDKQVTSIAVETGTNIDMNIVEFDCKRVFREIF
jgi:lipoyl(octanoyl) transferase